MRLPSWLGRSLREEVFGHGGLSGLGVRLMRTYDPRLVSGDVLCQLICLLRRSPLMYLSESGIWTYRGDEDLKLSLADVAADHQNFIDRAETILIDQELETPQSAYPLSFTGWHDVDLGFLLGRVIVDLTSRQREIVGLMEQADLAASHGGITVGRAAELVREVRAAIDGHIDLLIQQQSRLAQKATAPGPVPTG